MSENDYPEETGGDQIRTGHVKGTGIAIGAGARANVIIYEGFKPVTAGDLLQACQAQVNKQLYAARYKYVRDLYVHRAIERQLIAFIDAPTKDQGPTCFLIVAPAGSGKTNLLCDLARVRAAQQPVLLLLGGTLNLEPGHRAGWSYRFRPGRRSGSS